MRRAGLGLALLVLAIVAGALALRLPVGAVTAPGPGLFPLGLAIALGLTAAALVVSEGVGDGTPAARAADPTADIPAAGERVGGGAAPMLVVAAVAAYGLALEVFGLVVATAALLLVLWLAIERFSVRRAVAVTTVATAVIWFLFDYLLRVRFPRGWLGL